MKKLLRIVALAVLLSLVLSASAFAAQPRWTNIASISSNIDKIGDYYSCLINGNPGTIRIVCTLVLYEKNWLGQYTEVSRTSSSHNGPSHQFIGYYDMDTSKTYKLTINAVVVCNGSKETFSDSMER